MTWGASSPRWEWSFALQVEEVSPFPRIETNDSARMWINVGHLEAQHLFGNAVDDPTDLREDAALLNKLREKLYILWGDLEERKMAEDEDEGRRAKRTRLDDGDDDEQKPSNLPFNCCLQEYGALREGGCVEEIEDWERQFMMFGVTIS
jgi:protection-of-telomeres protein 1